MNTFSADYSSSIASSPAETPQRRKDLFSSQPQLISTTPLVPPPPSVFGSSRFGSGPNKPLFGKPSSPAVARSSPISTKRQQPASRNGLAHAQMRSTPNRFDESMDTTYDNESQFDHSQSGLSPTRNRVQAQSLMKFSPGSTRKSPQRSIYRRPSDSPCKLPRRGKPNIVPGVARDLVKREKPAALVEDDELVLETEQVLQNLQQNRQTSEGESAIHTVDNAAQELLSIWKEFVSQSAKSRDNAEIGLPPTTSGFDKAEHITSLLLSLYHPPTLSSGQQVPLPRAILDWLDQNHVSYDHMFRAVAEANPNAAAHEYFWDAIHIMALRGRLQDIVRLLGEADFKYAATSVDDGEEDRGYHGSQLQTIQSAIYEARQIVNACPGAKDDWDTFSESWDGYRSQLETELEMLARSAGEDRDDDRFEAENFGLRKPQTDLLSRSTKARKLPWSIYQGLRILYSILLGSAEEIIALSQDWLEASCALTVWWDGTADTKITKWSMDVSRAQDESVSDEIPPDSYLGRLRDSFLCVTDPNDKDSQTINNLSPVEVGLACVLQSQIGAAIRIIQTLSQTLADGVIEIASAGAWLGVGNSVQASELSSSDLMVLNYGSGGGELEKDDVLQTYASALFGRGLLHAGDGTVIPGWEISIAVLRRLEDQDLMHECLNDLLNQLDLTDAEQAEKAIYVCTELGLIDESRRISERYGDQLVSNSTNYGLALLCYTKSHSTHKIQQLTDLLISYCLVQSRAYPDDDEMDDALRGLVDSPRSAFADIVESDPEAGADLQFYMVGYACLRRFYTIRDQASKGGPLHDHSLLTLKRSAAKPLLAAINSAADTIYGGLYDSSRQSAIQVDGLLPLLGEATELLVSTSSTFTSTTMQRILSSSQLYALLAAIEDIETVQTRVYDASEECLQASIRNYHGSLPPSPHAMLKKSMSSGTNSNFSFSLMGSEMLAGSKESLGARSEGSAVVVEKMNQEGGEGRRQKGWDWRAKFGDGDEVSGKEVLGFLRQRIARELSLAELEGG